LDFKLVTIARRWACVFAFLQALSLACFACLREYRCCIYCVWLVSCCSPSLRHCSSLRLRCLASPRWAWFVTLLRSARSFNGLVRLAVHLALRSTLVPVLSEGLTVLQAAQACKTSFTFLLELRSLLQNNHCDDDDCSFASV
jgi:hypothetical protein